MEGPYHCKSWEPRSQGSNLHLYKEDEDREFNLLMGISLDLSERYEPVWPFYFHFFDEFSPLSQKANLMKFPHSFWKWRE